MHMGFVITHRVQRGVVQAHECEAEERTANRGNNQLAAHCFHKQANYSSGFFQRTPKKLDAWLDCNGCGYTSQ